MLESKRLPREMNFALNTKGRRQTTFEVFAGKGGPGSWTPWKEIHSYTKPMEISVLGAFKPIIARGVIFGEIRFIDENGSLKIAKLNPDQSARVKVGLARGAGIGRVQMRFKNNSLLSPANPSNRVDVKITVGYRG